MTDPKDHNKVSQRLFAFVSEGQFMQHRHRVLVGREADLGGEVGGDLDGHVLEVGKVCE